MYILQKKHLKRNKEFWIRYFTCKGSLPSLVVLGAPKCGTTSLYNYLRQHDSFVVPSRKEISFFAGQSNKQSLHWYKSNFTQSASKLNFDVSPEYLYSKKAAVKMKKIIPNARFIILLRNPVDRLFSHYQMSVRDRWQKKETFEDGVDSLFKSGLERCPFSWINKSYYLPNIQTWFDIFPDKSQTLVLKAEDFFTTPQGIFNDVCDYAGVPIQDVDVTAKKVGKYKAVMNMDTRKKLEDVYREHNKELEEFLGQKFNWY
jgi:hypothetical protein